MVHMLLPKIYRMRRRIKRQMERQQRLLEEAASQVKDGDTKWGAPGEPAASPADTPHPSWYVEELGECPVEEPTCPTAAAAAAGGNIMSEDMSDQARFSHTAHHHLDQQRGPLPGVRPPMGGPGGMVPPPQGKGSGAMGIIMPLYTVGIVVFFVYTIMKVLFKKGQDDDKTPKLKDFGLDPEYRKYVFAEEYMDNAEISTKDQFRRQQREESRSRKKYQQEQQQQQAETKIGGKGSKSHRKMDTKGKKLGEWYLPEGFMNQIDEDLDDEDVNISIGGTTVNESAHETYRDRLLEGIYWKKQQEKKNRTRAQLREQLTIEDIDWDDDISQLENLESQFRKQYGQGGKMQTLGEPVFEFASRKEEDMLDINDMYRDDFFQILKNGLSRCNKQNQAGGESIEELCHIARDHICSKQYARDPLSSHNHHSAEKHNYPEDARLNSSPGLFCKSKLMTANKPLGVPQSARRLHSSDSNSSGESEEDNILSSSKSGNYDNSHDVITEDLVDYGIFTEDKYAFKCEDEDTLEGKGDLVDDQSATLCI